MCGVIGIVGQCNVASVIYEGLTVLQHRGQDAAGMATSHKGRLQLVKGSGLVRDVFNSSEVQRLQGFMGIGHVRYPTAGNEGNQEAQPFYVNSPYGIALGHNGNLVNAEQLREELFNTDRRHINTDSDSEVLLNVFAHELHRYETDKKLCPETVFKAVAGVHRRCVGGYAVVALVPGFGLIGFRDPWGIRPLVLGQREIDSGREYMLASESVALDINGFSLMDDVAPGEAVYITRDGQLHRRQCADNPLHSPCIFEYVYFARPDSLMDDISVHKARLRMGEKLADRIIHRWADKAIDVVIPIPDTARTCAIPMAHKLGVKLREGFVKNRYVGRTFIMPGQSERARSVRRKLNPIDLEFRGKNVLLVDDSIVRGTTSRQIIRMAREAGAKKVFFASAAPPVRYPNVYGIDMPAASELIAHGRDEASVCRLLEADGLIYQTLDDLVEACRERTRTVQSFDTSCFSGEYVTGVDDAYLRALETRRNDQARQKRRAS